MQAGKVYSGALKNEEITRSKRKGVSFPNRREEVLETGVVRCAPGDADGR